MGVGVGVCGGAIRLTRHDSNAGNNPVGASLLAIAVCQPLLNCLIHRYREQARSHRGSGYTPEHFLLSDVIAAIASASLLPQFSVIARQARALHVSEFV
ncbi:hypothetical protein EMIT043CA1_60065 [Pseudomonas brassicacearum]